jgi:uncharacterized protein YaaR (DUF327 family)
LGKARAEAEAARLEFRTTDVTADRFRNANVEVTSIQREWKDVRKRLQENYDAATAEAALVEVQKVGAVAREEAQRRLRERLNAIDDVGERLKRTREIRAQVYREIIEEHREVTKTREVRLHKKGDQKERGLTPIPQKYRGSVEDSLHFYPEEWQAAFQEAFPTMRFGKVNRGHFAESADYIGLSYETKGAAGLTPVGEQLVRVGVHEIGHGMEKAVPGLLEMQHAWWTRRVGGARLKKFDGAYEPNGPDVKTRDRYTLKKYTNSKELDRHYEIFTTGVENILGDGATTYLDDDLIDFVLGSLLTL